MRHQAIALMGSGGVGSFVENHEQNVLNIQKPD